jgi:hypothetical protein
MATKEDLQNLSFKLAEEFSFGNEALTENVHRLFHLGSNTEICRLEFFDLTNTQGIKVPTIGLAFQIEVINTDAIVIFSAARGHLPLVELLGAYYQDFEGKFHRNLQAYIMSEQDKETKSKGQAKQELKIQQIEEWQMLQLERAGKLRVH